MIRRSKPLQRNTRPISRKRAIGHSRRSAAARRAWKTSGLKHAKVFRISPAAARRLAEGTRKSSVRDAVFARSSVCECCRCPEAVTGLHQMHECYERSKTRRMAADRRFDTRWCIRVCAACHEKLTRHRLDVRFQSLTRGANYLMWFTIPTLMEADTAYWYTAGEVWRYAA